MKEKELPFKDVREKLDKVTSITILSHINPDADTLGTALGIYALLIKDKLKRIEIVNASTDLPQHLDFLPNFKKIKPKIEYEDSLIISCDCGSIDRLGFYLEDKDILNIDHHSSNTRYGAINFVIPEYAAASQVAYKLFDVIGYEMSHDAATCFYTALLSDTRHFTTSTVTEEVFEFARKLVLQGAKPKEIAYHLTQKKSLASVRILQRALDSLTLHKEAKVVFLRVNSDDMLASGATISHLDGIADYGLSLVTVQIVIFAMEVNDGIRISLRSKNIDISTIALLFGGGGHKTAAGFTMKQSNLQESIDTIISTIDDLGLIE